MNSEILEQYRATNSLWQNFYWLWQNLHEFVAKVSWAEQNFHGLRQYFHALRQTFHIVLLRSNIPTSPNRSISFAADYLSEVLRRNIESIDGTYENLRDTWLCMEY